jgi:hypothetical protein
VPRVCSVCASELLAQISKALASGASNRDVARRFDVTDSAIQRHRVNCLKAPRRTKEARSDREPSGSPASLRFDSNQAEITSPKDLLNRLSTLFRLGELLESAYERRDVDACVKLAREYRAAAESYAKIAGWLVEGGGNTTLIDARRQSIALLGKLTEDELRALATGKPIEGTALALPAEIIDAEIGTDIRDVKALTPS